MLVEKTWESASKCEGREIFLLKLCEIIKMRRNTKWLIKHVDRVIWMNWEFQLKSIKSEFVSKHNMGEMPDLDNKWKQTRKSLKWG